MFKFGGPCHLSHFKQFSCGPYFPLRIAACLLTNWKNKYFWFCFITSFNFEFECPLESYIVPFLLSKCTQLHSTTDAVWLWPFHLFSSHSCSSSLSCGLSVDTSSRGSRLTFLESSDREPELFPCLSDAPLTAPWRSRPPSPPLLCGAFAFHS